jgi:biotin-(acetyl-CoA carboxylase) ligase
MESNLSDDVLKTIITSWEQAKETFKREGMSQNFRDKLQKALQNTRQNVTFPSHGKERRKQFGRMNRREQLAVLEEIVDLWKEVKRLHSKGSMHRLLSTLKKVITIIAEVF